MWATIRIRSPWDGEEQWFRQGLNRTARLDNEKERVVLPKVEKEPPWKSPTAKTKASGKMPTSE